MTDLISFVTSSGTTAPSSGSDLSGLADNFDTFLTLLTTQMQNQDPLAPLDSTEFTNQLVQFSSVEQQIKTNESITSLVAASNASTGASLSGYLGQTAQLNSTGSGYYGDEASWSSPPSNAHPFAPALVDADAADGDLPEPSSPPPPPKPAPKA